MYYDPHNTGAEEDISHLSPEEQKEHLLLDVDEPIEDKRKFFFAILFCGLGLGAIFVGLETYNPNFIYAGKLVFFLTILSSFLIPLYMAKKFDEKNKEDAENVEEKSDPDKND